MNILNKFKLFWLQWRRECTLYHQNYPVYDSATIDAAANLLEDFLDRVELDHTQGSGVALCCAFRQLGGGMSVNKDAFALWPKYSGVPYFPVPSPSDTLTPQGAYQRFPFWYSDYGASRMELGRFLVRRMREDANLFRGILPN